MLKKINPIPFLRRQPLWIRIASGATLALLVYLAFGRAKVVNTGSTFVARRGPLEINVLEGGSLEALESQDIKCEVRGYQGVKILKIVEEGYLVTEDDLRTNKVLVELDSSEIRKQITQQDIQFQSTWAALKGAEQAYDIQLNQNKSDLKAAEQKAKFARMDFEKFLGDTATREIVELLAVRDAKELSLTNGTEQTAASLLAGSSISAEPPVAPPAAAVILPPESKGVTVLKLAGGLEPATAGLVAAGGPDATPAPKPADATPAPDPAAGAATNALPPIDFTKYANVEVLGDGDAKQKLRKLDDDLQISQKEFNQAKTTLDGTKRLFEKGFVTKTELENDELRLDNSQLKVQTAETARALFLKYEFAKTAEEFLSKFSEANRELDRTRRGAISKLAQAEATLKSSQGRYNLEQAQHKELTEQLDKCVIHSKKTGLVVYGGGNNNMFFYGQEQIREGALVREQQPIITIPDMTRMAVKVRIHETYIKKIQKGQKVRITVEAFPDKPLTGEVAKVGVLPDSQNRWMNPDLKVYLTTIDVNGAHDWLKPGMSAKAEIRVKDLDDVVYVPIQSVALLEGKQYCYLAHGTRQERHEVEVGDFNDEFIEIKSGLKQGDKVFLRAPESEGGEKKTGEPAKAKLKPAAKAATPAPASPSK